jgi:4-hydroxybenzoate polyprenyltransferase
MSTREDAELRAIWKGQAVAGFRLSPEQLRVRAHELERQIRRRNLRDHISIALVAIICAYGVVVGTGGELIRVGALLMIAWALLSLYWSRLYGAMSVAPDADAPTVLEVHRRQLERQRDIALSWPWGLGLVIPGFVLVCIGMSLGPRQLPWTVPAVFIAVLMFMYVAVVIYGQILAGRWQREIDALHALEE